MDDSKPLVFGNVEIEPSMVFDAHMTFLEASYHSARNSARDLHAKARVKEQESDHIRDEIFKRRYGVRVGAVGVVKGNRWGSIKSNEEFRVTRFDSWGLTNTPTLHGVLRKKDGTWGERERHIGGSYEIVGYDPIEETQCAK